MIQRKANVRDRVLPFWFDDRLIGTQTKFGPFHAVISRCSFSYNLQNALRKTAEAQQTMAEDVFPVRSVRALLQNLRFLSLVVRGVPITRSRLQVLVQIPRRRHTSAHFSRVTVKPFNFMVSFLSPAQLNMGLRQKGGSSSAKGERQKLAATLRTFGKPFPP